MWRKETCETHPSLKWLGLADLASPKSPPLLEFNMTLYLQTIHNLTFKSNCCWNLLTLGNAGYSFPKVCYSDNISKKWKGIFNYLNFSPRFLHTVFLKISSKKALTCCLAVATPYCIHKAQSSSREDLFQNVLSITSWARLNISEHATLWSSFLVCPSSNCHTWQVRGAAACSALDPEEGNAWIMRRIGQAFSLILQCYLVLLLTGAAGSVSVASKPGFHASLAMFDGTFVAEAGFRTMEERWPSLRLSLMMSCFKLLFHHV